MDTTPLVRLRWRLRGAWLWPSWVVMSLADAVIVHRLPLSGASAGLASGLILGAVLSLLGIGLLGRPLGALVRRLRPDMPRVVARNYGGALITVVVTASLLAGGLIHQAKLQSDLSALHEATARAEAYIGAHAPATFQAHLTDLNTYVVQDPLIYRVCAPDAADVRFYCVVVNLGRPFNHGVSFSGSEPNSVLAQGTG